MSKYIVTVDGVPKEVVADSPLAAVRATVQNFVPAVYNLDATIAYLQHEHALTVTVYGVVGS